MTVPLPLLLSAYASQTVAKETYEIHEISGSGTIESSSRRVLDRLTTAAPLLTGLEMTAPPPLAPKKARTLEWKPVAGWLGVEVEEREGREKREKSGVLCSGLRSSCTDA